MSGTLLILSAAIFLPSISIFCVIMAEAVYAMASSRASRLARRQLAKHWLAKQAELLEDASAIASWCTMSSSGEKYSVPRA